MISARGSQKLCVGFRAVPRVPRPLTGARLVVHNVAGEELRSAQQPGKEPPQPPGLPILGQSLAISSYLANKGNLEQLLIEWGAEYGPFYEFRARSTQPIVVVSDPEAIKEVYEVLNHPKSPRYNDLLPLLGVKSMVVAEGHTWKVQRDAFNPGFSSTFLRAALPGFVSCTQRLIGVLGSSADRQEVVLMHHLMVLTTLEIICKVGFGEETDLLTAGRDGALWTSFESLGRHIAWFIDNLPFNWMKQLPWNRQKTERYQEQLDGLLMQILTKRLAAMGIDVDSKQQQRTSATAGNGTAAAAGKCPFPGVSNAAAAAAAAAAASAASTGPSQAADGSSECPFTGSDSSSSSAEQLMAGSTDILTLAIRFSQAEAGSSSSSSGQGLDLEMLLSQMKTFFAAGHDTTASLIGWTLWFMSQHPQVEKKLVDEVLSVMGPDSAPSYEQLTDMHYLNAVLKESLRIRPPVSVLARFAPQGSTLAGYNTSGKVILVCPLMQHLDTSVWGPDAAEFRPERWLEEGGQAASVPKYSYMPFSRGPRDCIGARFALLEAKTILSMMYRQFEFEYAGEQPEQVMMSVTAHPKFGVPLRVRWREGAPGRDAAAVGAAAAGDAAAAATAAAPSLSRR